MLALLIGSLLGCTDGGDGAQECASTALVTVFIDSDNDGYGEAGTEKQVCEVRRGFSTNDDDCDDFRSDVNPGAIEICDGIDNDCDTIADEGLREQVFYLDADGDTYGDPDTYKSITACGPPPGYVANRLDCDDANAGINPDALEICDGAIDNNCNGLVDDADPSRDLATAPNWFFDADGDSYGDPTTVIVQCSQPSPGAVLNGTDCNDEDPNVRPGAFEYCNRFDDDCDQLIDDSDPDLDPAEQSIWYADSDLDGAGDPNTTTLACFQPWFFVDNQDDCNDEEPLIQDPAPWVQDTDGDGYGGRPESAPACTAPGPDYELVAKGLDCDDSNPFINPLGNEICDGDDNDCDGLTDDADDDLDPAFSPTWYRDSDMDGYGDVNNTVVRCSAPPFHVANPDDCNDALAAVNPLAAEICDGIDNDCDGDVDDDDSFFDPGSAGTYWADFDDDGFGDANLPQQACSAPANYVDNDLDCDDTDDTQLAFGPWLEDVDGDGVGAGAPSAPSCTAPSSGWVPAYWGVDCAPMDETRYPGNVEICNNGNDEDCDGIDPSCFAPEPEALFEVVEQTSEVRSGRKSLLDAYYDWLRAWDAAVGF